MLAPGATAAFVADPYVVTAEDAAEGELVNVATASGTPPSGVVIEPDPDEVTTRVTAPPGAPAAPGDGGGLLPGTGSPVTWLALLAALTAIGTGAYASRRRRAATDSV